MSVIGNFTLAKDVGWTGDIRILTIDARLRLAPNDNRGHENAPAFRVMMGWSHVGDAWNERSSGESPKDYLRARLDDPSWPEPIAAALFLSDDGAKAQLAWKRRSPDRKS
jgi:uncharacterized protein (DUF736 family)